MNRRNPLRRGPPNRSREGGCTRTKGARSPRAIKWIMSNLGTLLAQTQSNRFAALEQAKMDCNEIEEDMVKDHKTKKFNKKGMGSRPL